MPELSVASFNLHWGRGDRRCGYAPFDVVGACARLDADVIVLQESWGPDDGLAQHQVVADALAMEAIVVPMGRSEVDPKLRLVSRADPARRDGAGDWCLALLTRRPVLSHTVTELPELWLDPSTRALLRVDLDVEGRPLPVVATHFSHLEFGSPLQTRALRAGLPSVAGPAVLVGDMNMWGWTISAMTPRGWRRAVRGKTWPARRPQHQIDHILVTPRIEVVDGAVLADLGSDHRPVRATLRIP